MVSNGANPEKVLGRGTLESSPSVGQVVQHKAREYHTVKEGLAYILNPQAKQDGKGEEQAQSVFYNPIQQFNRDLSVLAIRAYGEHTVAVKAEKLKKRCVHSRTNNKKKRKRDEGNGIEGPKGDVADTAAPQSQPQSGVNGTEQKSEIDTEHPEQTTAPKELKKTPQFSILDALSASGLRALRYAKEIPFVTRVMANDLSPSAVEVIKLNIQHNAVGDVVRPHQGDARALMYNAIAQSSSGSEANNWGKFDVIDLDPYGTAAPFMDAALQAISDEGLLCITCTDAGVFASNGYPEKAYALYGGTPMKGVHSHEGGLRLILNALATAAAKYGMAIEPLLSLSIDFYARVFVRVHRSPASVKFTVGKTMVVYNCDYGCGAWSTQPLASHKRRIGKKDTPFYYYGYAQAPSTTPNCEHCGSKTHLSGPMWAGPLHNPHFIQKILNLLPGADRETYPTVDRVEGMLTTALEEDLDLDEGSPESTPPPEENNSSSPSVNIPLVDPALLEPHPFFFLPSSLCKVLHTQTMSEDTLRGALRHLGYKSTRSHAKPGSIRTNAPWEIIWEIMREWVRQKAPVRAGAIREGAAGGGIMRRSREKIDVDGEGAGLRSLKRDLIAAVESGRDLSSLTTKVEAALYRSGRRRPSDSNSEPEQMAAQSESNQEQDGLIRPDPSRLNIVFDDAAGRMALDSQRKKRVVRYQVNPRPNWGPLNRATGGPS